MSRLRRPGCQPWSADASPRLKMFVLTCALRSTNPRTGQQGLFVNTTFTKRILELSYDESDAILKYLFRLQSESHDAQCRWRWSEGDTAIWDNASTLHAATFDYTEDRQGDRAVVVGEHPYFDAAGVSRAELLKQQV